MPFLPAKPTSLTNGDFVFLALVCAIYCLYFHPLSRFPGPTTSAISRIPLALRQYRGRPHVEIAELHHKYCNIVRIAPDQLSFQNLDAWKDIYGHRKGGAGENSKDPRRQVLSKNNLLGADRENHSLFRRSLAHGFSAQAIAEQQPLINKYIDLLIKRLHENAGNPVNMVSWYNWTTLDIIGDLSVGEPFGCLKKPQSHFWVTTIFGSLKYLSYVRHIEYFPLFKFLSPFLIPKELQRQQNAHYIDALMSRKPGTRPITQLDIIDHAAVLVIAGSQTTATTLSGTTYLLCKHPHVLSKLQAEVQSNFSSEDEIDFNSVSRLPCTMAVLNESLRIYPPVAVSSTHVTPPEGGVICSEPIPGNTYIDIFHWPTYRNSQYFVEPNSFIPERFLGIDPRLANDKLDLNCIGKNLAYLESRLVLARIVYNFDMELSRQS
ncbi:cytochrome P450 [Camillea tinctor]|nr:cytochrome P450 [Camillea tinctor]